MDVPSVGLGTLGLKESAEKAVQEALASGCQVVDTGEHYGNLDLVGKALQRSARKPFLVLKLSGLPVGDYDAVAGRLRAMLEQLGSERADLVLAHWPGLCTWDPTDMGPLSNPADFQGKCTSWEDFCTNIGPAWGNMLRLQQEGLTEHVGTSNFYAAHLTELRKHAGEGGSGVPFANEIFIDSSNHEGELVAHMQETGIRVLAYRPVAYKPFPEAVTRLAARLGEGISPQSLVLAWLLKRGVWPLVKCRGEHLQENMSAPAELAGRLTDADMEEMRAADLGLTAASSEWFAKLWKFHDRASPFSEEDVQLLVGMGVDEAKARRALEKCGGNIDAAMDAVFAEG